MRNSNYCLELVETQAKLFNITNWFYLMEDTVNTLFLSYSEGVIPSFKAECWTHTKDCLNAA